MTISVTIKQARQFVIRCMQQKLVPLLVGSPAIGKSDIVRSIAKEYGLKLIDMRLAQTDPTELQGFPSIRADRKKAAYIPLETLPTEGDEIPEGYNGWLVFLDEITSGLKATQAASYKVILDRLVGNLPLHSKVLVVAAGNRITDGAIVEELSTALQSRMVHFDVIVDPTAQEWLEWAAQANIDHRIMAYIRYKPELLYNFRPDHTDKTYASPRTWEFASRLIKNTPVEITDLPLLAGTIGEGVASEFITYCKIYKTLLTVEQILQDPANIPVPQSPSEIYALTSSLAANAKRETIDALMGFITRLPIEFQIITLRDMARRNPAINQAANVQQWYVTTGREMYS